MGIFSFPIKLGKYKNLCNGLIMGYALEARRGDKNNEQRK